MELFASQQQHIMQLYCSKHLNNAFRFFWKAMGLAYANPPFSLLAKVLTINSNYQLSIGVLRWGTTRLNLQGLRHEVPTLFRYNVHEGRYLRSVEW